MRLLTEGPVKLKGKGLTLKLLTSLHLPHLINTTKQFSDLVSLFQACYRATKQSFEIIQRGDGNERSFGSCRSLVEGPPWLPEIRCETARRSLMACFPQQMIPWARSLWTRLFTASVACSLDLDHCRPAFNCHCYASKLL